MVDKMERLNSIRRANLRALAREHSTGSIAKAAGYPSPSYLSQMIGPKARRPVSEESARKIEAGLGLPDLYLDQERDDYGRLVVNTPTVDADHFGRCAAITSNVMAAAGTELPTNKFASVVGMMMKHPDQSDEGLKELAKGLVALFR